MPTKWQEKDYTLRQIRWTRHLLSEGEEQEIDIHGKLDGSKNELMIFLCKCLLYSACSLPFKTRTVIPKHSNQNLEVFLCFPFAQPQTLGWVPSSQGHEVLQISSFLPTPPGPARAWILTVFCLVYHVISKMVSSPQAWDQPSPAPPYSSHISVTSRETFLNPDFSQTFLC